MQLKENVRTHGRESFLKTQKFHLKPQGPRLGVKIKYIILKIYKLTLIKLLMIAWTVLKFSPFPTQRSYFCIKDNAGHTFSSIPKISYMMLNNCLYITKKWFSTEEKYWSKKQIDPNTKVNIEVGMWINIVQNISKHNNIQNWEMNK